ESEMSIDSRINLALAQGRTTRMRLRDIILLDCQSTDELFCNKRMVKNIQTVRTGMRIKGNGGALRCTQQASVKGYHPPVWFNVDALTNIVSLKNMKKQFKITYSNVEGSPENGDFVVHRIGKPDMRFTMHECGLHYWDPFAYKKSGDVAFVNTVEDNKQSFTKRQIKDAEVARTLYSNVAYPSMNDFRWMVRHNQIKDCPVTVADIDVAEKIWGKNIAALKGKTVRQKPEPVKEDYIEVPKELLSLHKSVFLTADIFFVNGIPFLLALSRKITFTSLYHLANRTIERVFEAFKKLYTMYIQRGFRITVVHVDGEFDKLKTLIESLPGGPRVNLASANEHVPEIERRIRVVKERARAVRHSLPYNRIPKLLTIFIVFYVVTMLNYFPSKGGVSAVLSPKTIMTGKTLDYKKHLSLKVGQYCQVHEEETPRNSQKERTRGAIALGPSGNEQGSYKFMALNTGMKITRRSWDIIPIPDDR
ncbi:hypothetical protein ZOSMA_7339G00010, partial [Zostera marina]